MTIFFALNISLLTCSSARVKTRKQKLSENSTFQSLIGHDGSDNINDKQQ